MEMESRVVSAMRIFAARYKAEGKHKKYGRCMRFIAEFEKSYFD